MKHVATAYTQHGKLHFDPHERQALQEAVLVWADGPATVTVERQYATRSQAQNNYYWGTIVEALSEYSGHTPDESHEILKRMFLPKALAVAKGNGRIVAEFVVGGSTRELTTIEFFDYVERIRQWLFEELDVDVKPPDPEWREKVWKEKQKLLEAGTDEA